MERILNIMLSSSEKLQNSNLTLSSKIHMKDESKEDYINFCIKCFKGHFCVDLHPKKGWGLKCDACNFAVRMFEGAVRVKKQGGDDKRCQECGSYSVNVLYRENENQSLPPG
jgi:hypothetical protein